MRLAVVGVGEAGSRIANQIVGVEQSSRRTLSDGHTLLVNSTEPAFDGPARIPEDRQVLIGDVHQEINGHGIDGDPDLAAEIAREEYNELVRAFDVLEFHEIDGVLVVAGLGGGTGGGAGAVVIDQLRAICDEPIYGLGVLPQEGEGPRRALNAARSLRSFVENATNVIVFDNEAWHDGGTEPDDYGEANLALARRIVTLFAAGEIKGAELAETRIDPSDIMRTLDTGGISSIGFATTDLPSSGGLRRWFRLRTWIDRLPWGASSGEDAPRTDAAMINRLVRRAARSTLTLPCEIESAERALILLSGPPRALSRQGFESGRYWLEQVADTVDVKAGDEPHRGSELTALVLFSNVTDVPRIEAMQEQGLGAKTTPST